MNTARMRGQAAQSPERADARASPRTCVPISHHDQPLRCHRPHADPYGPRTAIAFSRWGEPQVGQYPPPGVSFFAPGNRLSPFNPRLPPSSEPAKEIPRAIDDSANSRESPRHPAQPQGLPAFGIGLNSRSIVPSCTLLLSPGEFRRYSNDDWK
jgi:hypothetical protein